MAWILRPSGGINEGTGMPLMDYVWDGNGTPTQSDLAQGYALANQAYQKDPSSINFGGGLMSRINPDGTMRKSSEGLFGSGFTLGDVLSAGGMAAGAYGLGSAIAGTPLAGASSMTPIPGEAAGTAATTADTSLMTAPTSGGVPDTGFGTSVNAPGAGAAGDGAAVTTGAGAGAGAGALGLGSIVPALISGVGSVAGGLIASSGAQKAAATQAAGGQAAIDTTKSMFDTTRADLAPYRDVGTASLYKLADYLGVTPIPGSTVTGSLTKPFSFDITQDHGYQFRLSEGERAITNKASAGGGISGSGDLSGATLKELLRYGQDYASGEYNAAFNRDLATKNQIYGELSGAAGFGSGATNTQVQAGTAAAGNIASTQTGIANALAAGQVGSANAIGGAVGNVGSNINQQMLLSSILNRSNPGITSVNQGVNLPSTLSQSDIGMGVG